MKKTLEEEKAALDEALLIFTNECRVRLHEMADRGKRGWDDPGMFFELSTALNEDARLAALGDRSHLTDISNRAMMLWWHAWIEQQKEAGSE